MRDPIDEIREALAHPDFLERIDAIRGYDVAEKRLLDRLEAAESARRDDYQNWMTALDRNAELLAKLEVAEKERDFAKTEVARLHDDIRELTDERVLDEEDRDRIVAWRQGTSTKPAPSGPDGWKEAAIAWEVCASIHREYGKGKDPFFNTRQGDFVKHANDARAMLAAAPEPNTQGEEK